MMNQGSANSDNDNGHFEEFEILIEGEAVWLRWPGRDSSLLLGAARYVFEKFSAKIAEVAVEGS
jgi:hypothetical protein